MSYLIAVLVKKCTLKLLKGKIENKLFFVWHMVTMYTEQIDIPKEFVLLSVIMLTNIHDSIGLLFLICIFYL